MPPFKSIVTPALTLLLAICSLTLRAEYQSWYITFKAVTLQNDTITGYVSVPTEYFEEDSITYSGYLLRSFDRMDYNPDGNFTFARHLVAYRFKYPEAEETSVAYTLVDTDYLQVSDIKHLEIVNRFNYTYLIGVANINRVADTIWAFTPTLYQEQVGGYLCDWNIFVHQTSKKVEDVLAKLKKKDAAMRRLEEEYEALRERGVSEAQEEAEKALNEREESIDEELGTLLKELEGEKVVIVSFCSC